MSLEIIALVITSFISIISLFISFKNYFVIKPKLQIVISDKNSDIYYGNVCAKDEKVVSTKIAAAEINIVNNSPVDIFIKDIKLKVGKNYHNIVDNKNSYWKNCYFFYLDKDENKIWDGCGIDYKSRGIKLPLVVKAYSINSGICLFHHFPNINVKTKCCKIVLITAVGKIKKRIKFVRYDENYISAELKDVKLYNKNRIN